jgi:hypothetical protein
MWSIKLLPLGTPGKAGSPRLTERFDLVKPLIARVQGFALGGGKRDCCVYSGLGCQEK